MHVAMEKEVVIRSKQGLHARPAALFVQLANKFDADITIVKGDQEVNGKSIMGILTLAAEKGARVKIIAEGHDAQEAIEQLIELISKDE